MDLSKTSPNDETGVDTGRTYGICVVHPRLLNPTGIVDGAVPSDIGDDSDSVEKIDIEFEASVCYCFITRFPLFEFFFTVSWLLVFLVLLANRKCSGHI